MIIKNTINYEIFSTLPTSTSSTNISSTSVLPSDDTEIDNETHTLRYLIIPILALGFVFLLTLLVLLFLKKKRLDRLRHHLIPFYNFAPGEEDWETELLEDSRDLNAIKGYHTIMQETSMHDSYLPSKLH